MTNKPQSHSAAEIFRIFFILGCTSFGGPVAHIGYFRDAFVTRRRWLSDQGFADLVALCQFLPGPASSQFGMIIGLSRAGYLGMISAWVAFTLPSAALMFAFAMGLSVFGGPGEAGWLSGLKAAAAAVVAAALLGMARHLATGATRAGIAIAATLGALLLPSAVSQIGVIIAGGLAGLAMLHSERPDVEKTGAPLAVHVNPIVASLSLTVFAALLFGLPFAVLAGGGELLDLFDRFYRTGALVFGGGHVVLPLLQAEVVDPGLVERDMFLAGYGAAQAVPGPLFAIAAYLGASTNAAPSPLVGALVATVAIFLPGALLVLGVLPVWTRLRANVVARRAIDGVNAAVVGLLAAAFYDPVLLQGVREPAAALIAAAAFVALHVGKLPAWAVVAAAALSGAIAL
jgi:chromate transporter